MAANPLSDYANNLDPHVKKPHYEKISCVGIDPILIPDKAYDPHCLPQVKSMDFRLLFLVLETSSYGKDQAYNQIVSGFVSCMKGPKTGNNYTVLGKVGVSDFDFRSAKKLKQNLDQTIKGLTCTTELNSCKACVSELDLSFP